MYQQINTLITEIKEKKPLIINITNYVTMDFVANGLLSLGASPIMTTAEEEVLDLLKIANAVVINMGTLNKQFIHLTEKVCQEANRLNLPLILDPVGAGATVFRTQNCLSLLEQFNFSIIRGNASEIMALAGLAATTKGVDSTCSTEAALESAFHLSSKYSSVIAISGQKDAVVSAKQYQLFERGSPLMPMITGSGCLLTSVLAAFAAVSYDHYAAVGAALVFYGACGESAAETASGPGSFKVHFLDALSYMPKEKDYA